MFKDKILNEFGKDIWMYRLTDTYHCLSNPTDKSAFEQTHLYKDIVHTIKNIANENSIDPTITLASLKETCDGGCLEAAVCVAYENNSGNIQMFTMELMSEY